MTSLWSSQPFKTAYTVGYWAINAPRLVFLSLRYVLAPLRPVPRWGYRLSLGTAFARAMFRYLAVTRFQRPQQMAPGKSKDRFVLIEPPDAALFQGALASSQAAVAPAPAPVGAVWHPAAITPESTGPEDKVIVYTAGGGFVMGWDPDKNARDISALTSAHFGTTHVLCLQYRLASPASPFPAAIQDLFTTYQFVLGLGVAPENIVVMGDSSGGNVTLGLLRYLVDQALPQPGGAVIFSSWVDVTTEAVEKYRQSPACSIDILDVPHLEWGLSAYRPRGGVPDSVERYISPANHPFRLQTPLFIESGGLEGFYESNRNFAEQMAGIEGNRVRFHTTPDMPHDVFLMHPVLDTKAAACTLLEEARRFLDEATARDNTI